MKGEKEGRRKEECKIRGRFPSIYRSFTFSFFLFPLACIGLMDKGDEVGNIEEKRKGRGERKGKEELHFCFGLYWHFHSSCRLPLWRIHCGKSFEEGRKATIKSQDGGEGERGRREGRRRA